MVAAAVMAVAGCGSSGGAVTPLSSGTATQAYQAARDGVAKDSMRVALGTPVLVEVGTDKSNIRGRMEITVTGIDVGSWTDLGETQQTAGAEGQVPVYLRATIKNVGTTDLPGGVWTPDTLTGVLAGGGVATEINALFPIDKCLGAFALSTATLFKPGTLYQTCTPVLANPAIPVIAVQWTNLYHGTRSILWMK
jgi:hypothetical protein